MKWRSWGDRKQATGGEGAPERLQERETLEIVAARLTALSGAPWRVEGGRVRNEGRLAVDLGHDHAGTAGHLDLVFVLDTERPEDTSLPDCVAGFGGTARESVERAVEIWATTSGAAVLELLDPGGRFATHFGPGEDGGFPGWHAIQGGITGWGAGSDHDAVQQWTADHGILPVIAPALSRAGLARDRLIGVKIFFGTYKGTDTAEVRVNGRVCEPAGQALLAQPWPRPAEGGSYARTYAVLVHRED
jgi:hypothetical protein